MRFEVETSEDDEESKGLCFCLITSSLARTHARAREGSPACACLWICVHESSQNGDGRVLADKRRERKRSQDEDSEDDDDMLVERELTEGVTERCVAALRKLAKEGLISREEKRRLLSDVIKHHQQGEEASEVEIAYELLVMRFLPAGGAIGVEAGGVGVAEEEDLLEDFADQVCTCV
jgi:hypothetical protein